VDEHGLGPHLPVVCEAEHVTKVSTVHALEGEGGVEHTLLALFFLSESGGGREEGSELRGEGTGDLFLRSMRSIKSLAPTSKPSARPQPSQAGRDSPLTWSLRASGMLIILRTCSTST
jgi:hypothetical protein